MINKFQQFIDRGLLEYIQPGIPCDAQLSLNSKLDPAHLGKIPGYYNTQTGKWSGAAWSKAVTTFPDIQKYDSWPTDIVCLLTGRIVGVDLDLDDPVFAQGISDQFSLWLGNTATRVRTNSSRLIRAYKLDDSEPPQKKRSMSFTGGGKIEILGDGQHFVACGTHLSGGVQTFSGEIITITLEQLNMFWEYLKTTYADKITKINDGGNSFTGSRHGAEVAYVATDKPTIAKAEYYINSLPVTEAGERDDQCFKIVTHVRQKFGIESETLQELMIPWGQRCIPPFPVDEIKPRVKSAYNGSAQGAQGEFNDDYMLLNSGFGQQPIPDHVSSTPITKKSRVKQPQPEIPALNQSYPINQPIHSDEWEKFHKSAGSGKPFSTLQNFTHMLKRYGISVAYDLVKKKLLIAGDCMYANSDITDNANHARLVDFVKMNQMDVGVIEPFLYSLMIENEVNPVAEWIHSKKWDGKDRIDELFNTLTLDPTQPRDLAYMLFRKWLIGAVKIVQSKINKFEFVLVLQDPKGGRGKTAWFNKLCPYAPWRKEGLSLDTADKDTIKTAVSHWLVELGELDSIFKRSDIKRLMSFLSNERDEIRLPYAKSPNEYSRRTAFFGTVNKREFLMDDSGDRRFWPIAVTAVDYTHKINMQQLWAQVDTLNERHWLDETENDCIIEANKEFKTIDPIDELLAVYFAKPALSSDPVCLTVTAILNNLGIQSPNKAQLNKAGAWLRQAGYRKTQDNGTRGYVVPLISVF